MKKKVYQLFICMLLIGMLLAVASDSVSADQDGDYVYITSGTPLAATITGYTGAGGDIIIPSILGGYPTVHIGDEAFKACFTLTSVVIPDSVVTIGAGAFNSCNNLTSVTIPGSVSTIGHYAFYFCNSLSSVIIPASVLTIEDFAFYYCLSLSSVTIGSGVTTIGDYAFYSCTSLSSLIITYGVTAIGNSTFSCCTALPSVIIPRSVTTIGSETFSYCSSLTSITFLGLVAPATVGEKWISDTPAEIRGHAYAASNFPLPGEVWNGLIMGAEISGDTTPPVAAVTLTPSNPSLIQTVTFNASASYDSDGSIILYEWDWNNDGVYEESHTTPITTHAWAEAGNYLITVRVTDNVGATSTKSITVQVSGEGGADNTGIPGFELICGIGAMMISILFLKKKRNR
ncbi:MAG: hypothetical protein BV459_03485 [Thermoplasmata archaeon M11B2D]|nr:MAG: hypothetical protein BV459_03485 [Thermoplasmata archaeon M11B2D]